MEDERKALWLSIVSLAITICVGFLPLWEAAPLFLKQVAPWVALVSGIIAMLALVQYARYSGWLSFGKLPWNTWRWYWFTSEKPREKYWLFAGKHYRQEDGELVRYTPGEVIELTDSEAEALQHQTIPQRERHSAGKAILEMIRFRVKMHLQTHPDRTDLVEYQEEYLQSLGEKGADLFFEACGGFWEAIAEIEEKMNLHAKIEAARHKNEPPRV